MTGIEFTPELMIMLITNLGGIFVAYSRQSERLASLEAEMRVVLKIVNRRHLEGEK
jgi:hypothetical protein